MKPLFYLSLLSTVVFFSSVEQCNASAAPKSKSAAEHNAHSMDHLTSILTPVIQALEAIENNQRNHSYVPDLLTNLVNALDTALHQLDAHFGGSDGDSRQVHAHVKRDLDQIRAAFAPFHPGASHRQYDDMYPIATQWIQSLRELI